MTTDTLREALETIAAGVSKTWAMHLARKALAQPSAPQDAALALPTEQAAVPSDEWQRGYTEGYGDGFRSVVPDPNATHKTKLLAAAPAAPEGDKDAEYELIQDDVLCAGTSGPSALKEIMHYAEQYAEDGPIEIYKVTRTRIAALPKQEPTK